MKKCLIIRYGAYGDIIHMSFLPRLLKENGYDYVEVETNHKGYQLLVNNPYIDKLVYLNPENVFTDRRWLLEKHWQLRGESFDKVINLYMSIEGELLSMEDDNSYYMNSVVRRNRWNKINFIDYTCARSGFPELVGKYTKGEVYYLPEEEKIVSNYMEQFSGKFTVLMNLSGTGPHKRMVQAKEVADGILSLYDNAHIILTGDKSASIYDFSSTAPDSITSIVGKFPFRQALLMAKHMNCVIGCESGLMCGATMWEVPTIQLMTAASIESHCKYNENDYSLQSPAKCSPCHKGPYKYYGCPNKDGNPLCVYFDVGKVLEKVHRIYERSYITA